MSSNILYTKDQIEKRIEELATEIANDYQGKKLILIGILKGAFVVTADLVRAMVVAGCTDVEVSFIIVKSYFDSTTTARPIQLVIDSDIDPKDREILIVDDIFDTGKSLQYVVQHFKEKGAASVESMTLLAKPDRHEVVYRPKYVGFHVENVWIEGYGMDSAEQGRGNPNVVKKDE